MTRLVPRRTVARPVRFQGSGLHSGVPVTVVVHPGSEGLAFRLGERRWSVSPEAVEETARCTRLGGVSTVEHLMAALAALEITDAEIEADATELPALDGCALQYWTELSDAGRETIGELSVRGPFARVFASEGPAKVAIAEGTGRWRYTFQSEADFPGLQEVEFLRIAEAFGTEIAPARTFGFERELPRLRELGLARGLDLDKALLLGESGYVNEPRFPDEPARHKLLDLIGDLYLAGVPPMLLDVAAERSGHRLHVEAARRLARAVRIERA
ncbi:MAG: UDP-3-O-acyl-N-acetylglucosamine deacetylase [Fimbriimonadales bacterium]|nr:UDP-3-O-acyl-N-acetylglucosamine deacetylase [Fimbriimonadales bacterium]